MTTWLDVARGFCRARGLDRYVDVLDAFRGPLPRGGPAPAPEAPWDGDFEALERERLADDLHTIAEDLAAEVDPAQARMFERRVRSVDDALAALGDDTGRLLRVGLRQRLRGILLAPRPRALRVRALADFYYSYAGVHRHRQRDAHAPSIARLVEAMAWTELAKGIAFSTIDAVGASGPVHANVLRVAPNGARFEVEDCRPLVAQGGSFETFARDRGAIAAMSGGFFLYSEPDIAEPSHRHDPVGLLLRDSEVLNPPVFRRGGLTISASGEVRLERIGMADVQMHGLDGRAWPTQQTFNRAAGSHGPAMRSAAVVGQRVVAVGHDLPIPLNGFVIPLPAEAEARTGDTVRYEGVVGSAGPLRTGIAGGPMLLCDGEPTLDMRGEDFWGSAPPVTFSQDETGDHNRLPRLAAGQRPDGTMLFAAIDGRNFERALGMTLGETAELLRALGCTHAVNLDGGSSKRMVVDGQTRDLPTTEILDAHSGSAPVRPVYTALLVYAGADEA